MRHPALRVTGLERQRGEVITEGRAGQADVVFEDYLRSNDYILTAYEKIIDGFAAAGGEREIPRAILGVKREYLEAAVDEMETKYGTIQRHFSEGLDIDAAKQQALRDQYLARD